VSTQWQKVTEVGRRSLCAAAAAVCVVTLSTEALAVAGTVLGKPIEDSGPLPISPAGAKRAIATGATTDTSSAQTAAALAVVVAGVGIALMCAPDPARRMLHVLAQSPLGAKGTVYVLRCGPRVLIVGAAAGQLTTLAEIADPDEIDELVRLAGTQTAGLREPRTDSTECTAPARQLKGQVDGMLDRIDSWKVSS
jgi:flagellar biogenesis protein FliO